MQLGEKNNYDPLSEPSIPVPLSEPCIPVPLSEPSLPVPLSGLRPAARTPWTSRRS